MEEKKIRVAQIIGKWVGGGVEQVVLNYYRYIDKNKIQFDFICDNDSTNIPYDEIDKLGGRVILIPPYQRVFEYNRELRKVFMDNQYKIVHSHINTLSLFPLRIAKKCNIPIRIAHSHSTTNKKECKKNLIKQILKPFSKRYANVFMCCSEFAGRWLFGNKVFNKGKVHVLNNAIELKKYEYDEDIRTEVRKELNVDEDTLIIGNIGRFVEQKNHTYLIDIFDEIQKEKENSILLLIGQGPLTKKIEEKVKLLGLENKVKFLGQRSDVYKLYQAMDCFVFPSLYEGLGMVLIEAQCSGLPCVASSEVPKNAKVIENTYFVDLDEDVKKWKEIVLKSLTNKRQSNLEIMTKNGYDIEVECKKLQSFYYNIRSEV